MLIELNQKFKNAPGRALKGIYRALWPLRWWLYTRLNVFTMFTMPTNVGKRKKSSPKNVFRPFSLSIYRTSGTSRKLKNTFPEREILVLYMVQFSVKCGLYMISYSSCKTNFSHPNPMQKRLSFAKIRSTECVPKLQASAAALAYIRGKKGLVRILNVLFPVVSFERSLRSTRFLASGQIYGISSFLRKFKSVLQKMRLCQREMSKNFGISGLFFSARFSPISSTTAGVTEMGVTQACAEFSGFLDGLGLISE